MEKEIPDWQVSDLVGSEVFSITGQKLGFLADVLPTGGGNDVWVVRVSDTDENDILVPALKTVVVEVDISKKKIIVDLPEGLKEIYED